MALWYFSAADRELRPGLDRRLDAGLLEQVLAVDEAERAGVPRHAVDPVLEVDLLLDPLRVAREEVVRQIRRHVEQALGEREARDVLELHVHHVRQALARLQHGAQLAVVRRALAHVLELDLDVRVAASNIFDGLVGAGRPRPHRDRGRLLELGRHVDFLRVRRAAAAVRRRHRCRRRCLRTRPPGPRAPRQQATSRARQRALSCRSVLRKRSPLLVVLLRGLSKSTRTSHAPRWSSSPEARPFPVSTSVAATGSSKRVGSHDQFDTKRTSSPSVARARHRHRFRSARPTGRGSDAASARARPRVRGPAACRRRSRGPSRARGW